MPQIVPDNAIPPAAPPVPLVYSAVAEIVIPQIVLEVASCLAHHRLHLSLESVSRLIIVVRLTIKVIALSVRSPPINVYPNSNRTISPKPLLVALGRCIEV